MKQPSSIPVILGQTASGKTSVGIELAKLLDGEIISVDSRKVYKGLTIGTATPEGEWKGQALIVKEIPHYLMGNVNPNQPYNAGDFAVDAEKLIEEILSRGKTPILVGGTGFYFKALQKGLPKVPPKNEQIRNQLEKRMDAEGWLALHKELAKVDPVAAGRINNNDRHKVIRALEVSQLTGKAFSAWKEFEKNPSAHKFTVIGPDFRKDLLDKRIEERSKHMVDRGMIEETKKILDQGYEEFCPALISFGYKEAVQVLEGKIKRSEFLPLLINGTKAYAKRQRTWFRTQTKVNWFECNESSRKEEIALKMKAFLENA